MKPSRYTGLAASSVIACALLSAGAAQAPRAALDRLTAARDAMGGATHLAAVKAFSATVYNRDRLVLAQNSSAKRPPFEFLESRSSIQMILPDHFRRIDQDLTFPGQPGVAWGFAGKTDFGPDRLRWRFREGVGYFLLTLLLRTDTVFPFTLRGLEGNTLRLSDPNGVDVFIDLDPTSSLPQTLRYDLPERTMDGAPTGRRRPTRVVLEAHAPFGRLRLPRTVKTFEGPTMMMEHRLEAIDINPKLLPASFTR